MSNILQKNTKNDVLKFGTPGAPGPTGQKEAKNNF